MHVVNSWWFGPCEFPDCRNGWKNWSILLHTVPKAKLLPSLQPNEGLAMHFDCPPQFSPSPSRFPQILRAALTSKINDFLLLVLLLLPLLLFVYIYSIYYRLYIYMKLLCSCCLEPKNQNRFIFFLCVLRTTLQLLLLLMLFIPFLLLNILIEHHHHFSSWPSSSKMILQQLQHTHTSLLVNFWKEHYEFLLLFLFFQNKFNSFFC